MFSSTHKRVGCLGVGLLSIAAGFFLIKGCGKDDDLSLATFPYRSQEVPDSGVKHDLSSVGIASFNIQFLGHFRKKEHQFLLEILKDQKVGVVAIQELMSVTEFTGIHPEKEKVKVDHEATQFAEIAESLGFAVIAPPFDTGPREDAYRISGTTGTEFPLFIYDPTVVEIAEDLPNGFIDQDRYGNAVFSRVPYVASFRRTGGGPDFSLISQHLRPGDRYGEEREDALIFTQEWARNRPIFNSEGKLVFENDWLIAGDLNTASREEFEDSSGYGFTSLNQEFLPTMVKPGSDGAYDHFLADRCRSDLVREDSFEIVPLLQLAEEFWRTADRDERIYGGSSKYDHDWFRQRFSDHNPIIIRLDLSGEDRD